MIPTAGSEFSDTAICYSRPPGAIWGEKKERLVLHHAIIIFMMRHIMSRKAMNLRYHINFRETQVQSLGPEDLLEKEMATYSSILAWNIP